MPFSDSSTICVRRHLTTDPDDRRTIRNSRFPGSLETSRTRKPSLDTTTCNPTPRVSDQGAPPARPGGPTGPTWPDAALVAWEGTPKASQ